MRGFKTNYVKGAGILTVATIVDGVLSGFRDFGDTGEITMARSSSTTTINENRTGLSQPAQIDESEVTYEITAALKHVSMDNLALALQAEVETRTVSATPVTGEVWSGAFNGAVYYPGLTPTNADGIRILTTFDSLAINASARADSTAYTVGTIVTNSSNAYVYTVAGTSAASPPTFPSAGGTVADGTATLKHLGPVALVVTTDYVADLSPARVQIAAGGDFATSLSRMPAGYSINLVAGYTPVATTQLRLKARTGTAPQLFVRFDGATAKGTPMSWTARYCAVSSSGDLGWISPDAELEVPLQITPTSPDSGLPVQFRQEPSATDWFTD